MNLEISITIIRLFYLRHKEYIVPFFVIVVSMAILAIVIPFQIKSILLNRENSKEMRKKITILRENIGILSQINNSTLDNNLSVASEALPSENDFETVFQAISNAAASSGVSVDDYGLDGEGTLSQLPLNLSIRGDGLNGATQFVSNLQKRFPLSEVNSLNLSKDGGTISVVFFFKEFPKVTGNTSFALKKLSKEQISTLNSLFDLRN